MRRREIKSTLERIHSQAEEVEAMAKATKLRAEEVKLAELKAEGYRPYVLYVNDSWGSKGFLISYQYSKDSRWLDIQEKGKLITVPINTIVRFEVTDGVMIDR